MPVTKKVLRRQVQILFWGLLQLFMGVHAHAQSEPAATAPIDTQWPMGLVNFPQSPLYSDVAFVVDKSQRMLAVWKNESGSLKKITEFPTDIGKNDGDKFKGGDAKTPEGIYFLNDKLVGPSVDYKLFGSMAFVTDYPNFFDLRLGKTGSGIWLHAIPDTVALTRGSRGCVVVRDNVIKELSQFVTLKKTPLLIYDKIIYANSDTVKKRKEEFDTFLEGWKASWEKKDLESYMSFYHQDFRNQHMNWKAWKEYKKTLNEKYKFVKVQLTDPQVLNHKDDYIVRTVQKYESDVYGDSGEKILFVKHTPQGYKILGEEWKTLPNNFSAR